MMEQELAKAKPAEKSSRAPKLNGKKKEEQPEKKIQVINIASKRIKKSQRGKQPKEETVRKQK